MLEVDWPKNLKPRHEMKSTKNNVASDTTLQLSPKANELELKIARPLRSLRPMKSMVRVKSFRPKKIEIAQTKSHTRIR
jgi:hypothetical protein